MGEWWNGLHRGLKILAAKTVVGSNPTSPTIFMKKRKHFHYIVIAFGTVLFWRGVWNLIDRIPHIQSSFLFDIGTGTIGLILLYFFTKSFRDL